MWCSDALPPTHRGMKRLSSAEEKQISLYLNFGDIEWRAGVCLDQESTYA